MAFLIRIRVGGGHGDELFVSFRIGLRPVFVVARIGNRNHEAGALFGVHLHQCVKRIGGAARATGRGAGKHQAFDHVGMIDRKFLRDHAAEGDADDEGGYPADGGHEVHGVLGILRHGVGGVRLRGLSEAALVIGEHVEMLREGTVQHIGTHAKVAARARNEEEAGAGAHALVPDVDIACLGEGHGASPSFFRLSSGKD